MSTTTTNYGLVKPELTDVADITAMNPNWDKIDEELSSIGETVEEALGNLTPEAIGAVKKDLSNATGILPIEHGGTGATNANTALANLGALPKDGSVPMNGNLTIERAGYTRVTQNNTATGATAIQAITDNGNSGYWNFKDANGVEHEIRMNGGNLEYKKDGQYHKLFGQHNASDMKSVIQNLIDGGEILMSAQVKKYTNTTSYTSTFTVTGSGRAVLVGRTTTNGATTIFSVDGGETLTFYNDMDSNGGQCEVFFEKSFQVTAISGGIVYIQT